jgi:hypothetical protein
MKQENGMTDKVYVALASDRYGISYGVDKENAHDAVMNCFQQLSGEIDKPVKVTVYEATEDWKLEAWSILATELTKLFEEEFAAKHVNAYLDAYRDMENLVMLAEEQHEPEKMGQV